MIGDASPAPRTVQWQIPRDAQVRGHQCTLVLKAHLPLCALVPLLHLMARANPHDSFNLERMSTAQSSQAAARSAQSPRSNICTCSSAVAVATVLVPAAAMTILRVRRWCHTSPHSQKLCGILVQVAAPPTSTARGSTIQHLPVHYSHLLRTRRDHSAIRALQPPSGRPKHVS